MDPFAAGDVEVRILGHVCWWSARNVSLTKTQFAALLAAVGLPTRYAREHNYRSAFIRALRNLEEKRIIRPVSENESHLVYQFTAERQTTADGDPALDYERETVLVIDKNAYREHGSFELALIKGRDDIRKQIVELFEGEKERYNSGDMTRYLQRIFRERADIVSLREQGSVYFVPAADSAVIEAVSAMVAQIPGLTFDTLPVPDVDNSRNMLRHAVVDDVQGSIDGMLKEIEQTDLKDVTDVWRKTRMRRIEDVRERIDRYAEVLQEGDSAGLLERTDMLERRLGGRKLILPTVA